MGESRNIALVVCIAVAVGLVLSRFIVSAAVILLVANAVLTPEIGKNFKRFLKNKVYLVISSLLILYLLSGLWTTNTWGWIDHVRVKLPFLLLPFAFAGITGFNKKYHIAVLVSFALVIVLSSVWALFNYMTNFSQITESYSYAQVLPTISKFNGISHIRFSLMVAYAAIICIYLAQQKLFIWNKNERFIYIFLAIFLIVFLHIFSVRSGMMAFYFASAYFVFRYIQKSKQFLLGALLIIAMVSTIVGAYYAIPSFQRKMQYMSYDIDMLIKGNDPSHLSDASRIISMKAGIKVAIANPVIGVGVGDLKTEVSKIYKSDYPGVAPKKRLTPHNQFIYIVAGLGIIGLIWFIIVIVYPILVNRNFKAPLFVAFNIIVLTSFIVEHTVEAQIGTAFYLIFLLLNIDMIRAQKEEVHG